MGSSERQLEKLEAAGTTAGAFLTPGPGCWLAAWASVEGLVRWLGLGEDGWVGKQEGGPCEVRLHLEFREEANSSGGGVGDLMVPPQPLTQAALPSSEEGLRRLQGW